MEGHGHPPPAPRVSLTERLSTGFWGVPGKVIVLFGVAFALVWVCFGFSLAFLMAFFIALAMCLLKVKGIWGNPRVLVVATIASFFAIALFAPDSGVAVKIWLLCALVIWGFFIGKHMITKRNGTLENAEEAEKTAGGDDFSGLHGHPRLTLPPPVVEPEEETAAEGELPEEEPAAEVPAPAAQPRQVVVQGKVWTIEE